MAASFSVHPDSASIVFDALDADGDGFVNVDELTSALTRMFHRSRAQQSSGTTLWPPGVSVEDVARATALAAVSEATSSTSHAGRISWSEFTTWTARRQALGAGVKRERSWGVGQGSGASGRKRPEMDETAPVAVPTGGDWGGELQLPPPEDARDSAPHFEAGVAQFKSKRRSRSSDRLEPRRVARSPTPELQPATARGPPALTSTARAAVGGLQPPSTPSDSNWITRYFNLHRVTARDVVQRLTPVADREAFHAAFLVDLKRKWKRSRDDAPPNASSSTLTVAVTSTVTPVAALTVCAGLDLLHALFTTSSSAGGTPHVGNLNLTSLACALTTLTGGDAQFKLSWAFNFMDLNADGLISRLELYTHFHSCMKLLTAATVAVEVEPLADAVRHVLAVAETVAGEMTDEAFHAADLNRDGFITMAEMKSWLDLNAAPASPDTPKASVDAAPPRMDLASMRSALGLHLLPTHAVLELLARFACDGWLTSTAWSHAITALGDACTSPAVARALFTTLDVDANGRVDFAELAVGVAALTHTAAPMAFSCLDSDGDGYLNREEMYVYMLMSVRVAASDGEVKARVGRALGVDLTEPQLWADACATIAAATCDDVFNAVDVNGDGRISAEEFDDWFKATPPLTLGDFFPPTAAAAPAVTAAPPPVAAAAAPLPPPPGMDMPLAAACRAVGLSALPPLHIFHTFAVHTDSESGLCARDGVHAAVATIAQWSGSTAPPGLITAFAHCVYHLLGTPAGVDFIHTMSALAPLCGGPVSDRVAAMFSLYSADGVPSTVARGDLVTSLTCVFMLQLGFTLVHPLADSVQLNALHARAGALATAAVQSIQSNAEDDVSVADFTAWYTGGMQALPPAPAAAATRPHRTVSDGSTLSEMHAVAPNSHRDADVQRPPFLAPVHPHVHALSIPHLRSLLRMPSHDAAAVASAVADVCDDEGMMTRDGFMAAMEALGGPDVHHHENALHTLFHTFSGGEAMLDFTRITIALIAVAGGDRRSKLAVIATMLSPTAPIPGRPLTAAEALRGNLTRGDVYLYFNAAFTLMALCAPANVEAVMPSSGPGGMEHIAAAAHTLALRATEDCFASAPRSNQQEEEDVVPILRWIEWNLNNSQAALDGGTGSDLKALFTALCGQVMGSAHAPAVLADVAARELQGEAAGLDLKTWAATDSIPATTLTRAQLRTALGMPHLSGAEAVAHIRAYSTGTGVVTRTAFTRALDTLAGMCGVDMSPTLVDTVFEALATRDGVSIASLWPAVLMCGDMNCIVDAFHAYDSKGVGRLSLVDLSRYLAAVFMLMARVGEFKSRLSPRSLAVLTATQALCDVRQEEPKVTGMSMQQFYDWFGAADGR